MSVTRSVTKSLSSFQWPWQYDFKPFYTIQPNLDTRAKQLEAWCELVLAYHRHTKAYVMDVNEALSSELFYNAKINRKLPPEGVNLVLSTLESRGNVEWQDKSKTRCLVMWRSPQEWGKMIYQWVCLNRQLSSAPTIRMLQYYLTTKLSELKSVVNPSEKACKLQSNAQDKGLGSSVCTLYEIHSGEHSEDQEFYNIELWMLKRAIEALAREGKAELIPGSSPDDSDAGVKFFS